MKEKTRVLVVDDDAVVGQSFNRVLTGRGYQVSTAHSGTEALRSLVAEHFDLLVTDIKMPGMDGLEVAQRVKEMNPWLPVVIVTGYGTEVNEKKAREIGVADFVRKPLSPEMIEKIAGAALHQEAAVAAEPAVAAAAAVEAEPARVSRAKNVALFFAAPFVGLAYIIAFPFVGFAALLKWGMKSLGERKAPGEQAG